MKPSLEDIRNATLCVLGIEQEEYEKAGKSREARMVRVRQIVSLFGQHYGYSQAKIGDFLNLKHSTVHHGKLMAKDYYKYEKEYAEIVDEVERILKEIEGVNEACAEHTIVGWVARDSLENKLNFFTKKPRYYDGCWTSKGEAYSLPVEYFPQIEHCFRPQTCEISIKLK